MKIAELLASIALIGVLTWASSYDVKAYLWTRLTVANNSTSPYLLPALLVDLPLNDTYQRSQLLNFTVRVAGQPVKCRSRIVAGDCGSRLLEVFCPAQLPPESTAELEVTVLVEVKRFRAPELNFEVSGRLAEIPRELAGLTAPAGPWRYDQPTMRYLAEAAPRIVGDENRVLAIVAKLVDWIWGKVDYEAGKGPRYPNETLPPEKLATGTGKGDCDDQANLLILMLRSLGVPAYLKTALVADFNYGEERMIWNPENHYYYAFYGIHYGHAWAEVYVPPWGWLPVDLTYHAQTGGPLDAIRTSATSEVWARLTIMMVRIGNVCHDDYIGEFRSWGARVATTPLFYYWEYAVVREGDSIARVKSFLKPIPLPWVKPTQIEVRYPSRARALERIEVSGSLSPGLANATILLYVRKPSGRTIALEARTNHTGSWKLVLDLDEAGAWQFNVTFPGLREYAPSSESFSIYVEKRPSELEMSVAQRDGELVVEGRLTPPLSVNLTLSVTTPSGTARVFIVPVAGGSFSFSLPAEEPGRYSLFALWAGNEVFDRVVAFAEVVVEAPTRLEIETSWSNGLAVVKGTLKPALQGATVLVEAISGGRRVERRVNASADGTFQAQLELGDGVWLVIVTFEGAPGYKPCRASATIGASADYSAGLALAAAALAAWLTASYLLLRKKCLRCTSSTQLSPGSTSGS